MAARRKQVKIRFELTRGAIAGIGVVVFCLFLWMFLFGVWAGQSLLAPRYSVAADSQGEGTDGGGLQVIRAVKKVIKDVSE